MEKWVYSFKEGSASMRDLLGGKGSGLAEMTRIGIPVPPGFTITTRACIEFFKRGGKFPEGLKEQVLEYMKKLEEETGKKFGDKENPLLVSVRSGAPVSMPGMMDTILNLGLNDETVEGLIKKTGDPRFAYDCYRRLIQMFGNVVMGIPKEEFEEILEKYKRLKGVKYDAELDAETLKKIIEEYKKVFKKHTGRDFPQDPYEQLFMAIKAVFNSWNNKRAIAYRRIHGIPDDMGTACNIQMMAFGNMGWDSGTGVLFTRNPSTGEKKMYGEVLLNAQGEDVVAGIRTPMKLEELRERFPEIYNQLIKIAETLEKHYRDMQDIEFTIENGKLYILQTRTGKRTPRAAVKIAVDMAREGIISKEEAVLRVSPEDIERLLHKQVDPEAEKNVIAKGLPASPGAAVGKVVFDPDEAEKLANEGEKVILVRPETSPDDVHGMAASQGILTSRGGMTSHAAVVARGMGKPAVVGCEEIYIDLEEEIFKVKDIVVKKGDIITIDGTTGEVMLGEVPLIEPKVGEELSILLKWCDEIRKLGVMANADTAVDAAKALEFGAEGIGLARTEHMFLGPERVKIIQEMVLAETPEDRKKALEKLIPMQINDFMELLKVMDGKPVQIRLLDPPLHEFLPSVEELMIEIRKLTEKGAPKEEIERLRKLLEKVRKIQERNPMLGFRVCRLGIVYPEIYEAQARAIFEATARLIKEGYNPRPEVMIPGTMHVNELKFLKRIIDKQAKEVMEKYDVKIEYKYGTMIEMPRAALTADEIATVVDFFSFGTNDLTQTTMGLSRDDAQGTFLPIYIRKGILKEDPFKTLDVEGVGKLIEMGVKLGRKGNPKLKIGICGEHGGDPASIHFLHKVGLDYVSCSPYRVPIARLAAAQAALREKLEKKS
ncbi:pyruvate, phosphate dikinase [archaeon]|nr:MAG: pyruvate, phosphate dikinase [archaeon]HDM24232.1 pyruvate, phosphate dikinase [Candidatus Bathyarchaeota archaeon]